MPITIYDYVFQRGICSSNVCYNGNLLETCERTPLNKRRVNNTAVILHQLLYAPYDDTSINFHAL